MVRSKHWADTYKWVGKIVDSVKTPEQKSSAFKLISNWYYQTRRNHPQQDLIFISRLESELKNKLYDIRNN